jgi:hypothetical protein
MGMRLMMMLPTRTRMKMDLISIKTRMMLIMQIRKRKPSLIHRNQITRTQPTLRHHPVFTLNHHKTSMKKDIRKNVKSMIHLTLQS